MTKAQLCDLLGQVSPPVPDFAITSVTERSDRAVPGTLFVALRGANTDGHDYAADAVARGAAAILGNRPDLNTLHGVPYFYSEAPRRALGLVAHHLAGHPTRALTVVGITGTNGKSSTAFLVQAILNHAGHPCANFGTLGYDVGAGERLDAPLTTPFPEQLAEAFAHARRNGLTHAAMEASSHALDQERVAGIEFDVGAFTNLTRDHLDYHSDMDAYRRAKLRLFEAIAGEGRFTAVNTDDPSAEAFRAVSRVRCITYGTRGDVRAEQVVLGMGGTTFRLRAPWGGAMVELSLLGRHNVWNALCAAAVCGGLGLPPETIAAGIASLACVPGRFEPVNAGQDFQVVVDYAHTDDALENVLTAARQLCKGRVIAVFGCGGDRDKGKRPKMGAVAARLADFSVITSDNPRTEEPERILLDIEVGFQHAGRKKDSDYRVIEDRADAIREGIGLARPGDLVLIAGKGHEDYQIVGRNRRHFDDRETARAVLEGR